MALFTRSDLSALMAAAPPLGVSMFLPTHVRGGETRQDPIRLKNLVSLGREKLLAAGLPAAVAEGFVAPAAALVDDYGFWQHQDQGLALFLDGRGVRRYLVPLPLSERVVVAPGFHVKPLLPVLAADGAFQVLTVTEGEVRLFDASRFAIAEDEETDLPRSLGGDFREPDYENPVQASPVARPHTGSVDISNAQVYGDSPAEWRKARLVESVRRLTADVERHLARRSVPLVLVASAEIGGHFKKFTTLGPRLVDVIEVDPEAMDRTWLHDAAYAAVQPHLDADRGAAIERIRALLGGGDPRAVTGVHAVIPAARQGRVDTLLLAEGATILGGYDESTDRVTTHQESIPGGVDLLDTAAVHTLQHGGDVHLFPTEEMPDSAAVAAVLRY